MPTFGEDVARQYLDICIILSHLILTKQRWFRRLANRQTQTDAAIIIPGI
jgi:hypothetical protein